MTKLKVREIAEKQGYTMYSLQQATGLSMGTIRRYWYNSSDGKEQGEPLKVIYLEQLTSVANVLQVTPGALLTSDEPSGNDEPLRLAA